MALLQHHLCLRCWGTLGELTPLLRCESAARLLLLEQTGFRGLYQPLPRDAPVGFPMAGVRGLSGQARGLMDKMHAGFHLVDVLPSGTLAPGKNLPDLAGWHAAGA